MEECFAFSCLALHARSRVSRARSCIALAPLIRLFCRLAFSSHFYRPSLTPIDSTFCYAYRLVHGNPRGPTIGHSRPEGEVQLPLPLHRSVHGYWRLDYPPIGGRPSPSSLPRNGHSRPWGSLGYLPLYRCM